MDLSTDLHPDYSRWFPYAEPASRKTALCCLPYAGGAASSFRDWASFLPELAVDAVQLPGREQRVSEAALTNPEQVIELLLPLLRHKAGNYALYGHSMGAKLALALARRLSAEGKPPRHLFVGASALGAVPFQTADLNDAQFIAELTERNQTLRAALSNDALVKLLLPLWRADFLLTEALEPAPEPLLACPISAFAASGDSWIEDRDMAPWRLLTSGSFALHVIESDDHLFCQSAAKQICQIISAALSG